VKFHYGHCASAMHSSNNTAIVLLAWAYIKLWLKFSYVIMRMRYFSVPILWRNLSHLSWVMWHLLPMSCCSFIKRWQDYGCRFNTK